MQRTTPPRPLDVLAVIPELAEHAREATRLHPRRGTPAASDSSIGGPLLWPADEPWPTCSLAQQVERGEDIDPDLDVLLREAGSMRTRRGRLGPTQLAVYADPRLKGRTVRRRGDDVAQTVWYEPEPHSEPNPMVPIAQLHAADVPTVTFPEGKDLLQVLWCPVDHMNVPGRSAYCGPTIHVVWRTVASIGPLLTKPPRPHTVNEDFYLPQACVLYPEQVTEYQYADLLPDDLRSRVDAADDQWHGAHYFDYQADLSIAPGCKAGGWATWNVTDPWHRTCTECGSEFCLLLSLDSREWDAVGSWKPVEGDRGDSDAQCPTGLTHGRWGATRIFTCSANPRHPFEIEVQ